jgi:hypothetical protein
MNVILRRWRQAPREYFALCPDEKNPDKPEQCRILEHPDTLTTPERLAARWINYEDAIHNSKPATVTECVDLASAIVHQGPYDHVRFIKHKPTWNRHYKKGLPCPTNS